MPLPSPRSFARLAPCALLCCLALPPALRADEAKATQAAITSLLQEFLAKNDEAAQHQRFWAEDLVYTSSAGEVTSKAEIMKSFTAPPPEPKDGKAQPAEPASVYSAEEVLVRAYGNVAALTFRLVRRSADGKTQNYRNSGTFLYRNGKWQAITWQATKVPSAEGAPAK
jgi:hypothetical protein